jgi:proteasome beta subunit
MNNDKTLKTGTTTIGIIAKDGVIIASEKKATIGYMVDSKVAKKVYKLDDHIGLTIAGSVGDAMAMVRILKAQFRLFKLDRGPITIKAAASLLSNILHNNKYYPYYNQFIIAGFDKRGPQVYSMDPVGGGSHTDKYYSTGSGSPFAYGVLEGDFKENLSKQDAAKLAVKALRSAVGRDIASGGKGFTVVIIDSNGYHELTDTEISKLN